MEWINCEDRLPGLSSIFTYYIVCVNTGGGSKVEFAWYEPSNKIWWDVFDMPMTAKVTHWMPMPEAPV